MAAATHQSHDSGSRPRRKYLDYHPIDREWVITFTVKTDKIAPILVPRIYINEKYGCKYLMISNLHSYFFR